MAFTKGQNEWLQQFMTEQEKKAGMNEIKYASQIANEIKSQWTLGGLMTLGAREFTFVLQGLGNLIFKASILPMKKDNERADKPQGMMIVTELTVMDDYKVYVIDTKGQVHYEQTGLYFDDLQRLALALDYNGEEVLNPRYA